MKKLLLLLHKFILLVVLICINFSIIQTYALTVNQDPIGIYCIKDDGKRAVSEWVMIDFDGDNYLEYYYFDVNGYLILKGFTPDGYIVNEKGQWIVNGVVQKKYYGKTSSKNNSHVANGNISQNKYDINSNNYPDYSSIILFFIIIFIALIAFAYYINKHIEDKNNTYNYYRDNYKPATRGNTYYNNDTTVDRSIWWHLRSDNDKTGEEGEDQIANKLKYLGNNFVVLRDVNIPRKNNKPVQIDFLCISNKAIFVIEVKNWLGTIFGSYEDDTWHSKIYDIDNIQINPIKQNEWHVDFLKRIIKQNIDFYSIVVFTNRSDIRYLGKIINNTYVTDIDNLNSLIYQIQETSNSSIYKNYNNIAEYINNKFVS